MDSIIKKIETLKIQGAENVAKAALKVINLKMRIHTYKEKSSEDLLKELDRTRKLLFRLRPTEPCMRNTVNFVLSNLETRNLHDIYQELHERIYLALKHFDVADIEIARFGAKKIHSGMVVFTHCHSTTVMNVLKEAKRQKKRFVVHNTEARPNFQGRITAAELAKLKIPVVHFVDSAGRLAMKDADLFLFGADAITSEGKVINKIGTEMFAELATKHDVSTYCCTDSWKFDPKTIFGYEEVIEERPRCEVWPRSPKGVRTDSHVFEKISPELITGVISELGIMKPTIFLEEVRRNYKWMFK